MALGLAGCVLASPDFDPPTESDAATVGGSAPGSGGESESGGMTTTTSASDSGSGTASEGSSGTTTSGSTTLEPTTGTTEEPTSSGTTEPTTSGTTTEGDAACDLSPGAWSVGEAVAIGELNTEYTEADPVLLSDGLTLVFSSNRPGGLGLFDSYYAVRSGFGEPFGPPLSVEAEYGWNHSSDEGKAELTGDGLEVVFSSSYSGGYKLWRGLRASVNEPFPGYALLAALQGDPGATLDPHLSADGLRVYFARQMGGQYDIYVTARPQLGVDFGAATLVAGVNTNVSEANPSVSDDQRLMIFARRVGGEQIDLFTAHRPDANGIFDPPQPLAELNTGFDDAEPYLAEVDGKCELFFVSDRGDGTDWDLYRAPIL